MNIEESLRDFTTRYEKTFIFVVPPNSTEESLFHVDKITPDRDKIANLTLSSPDFGKIILNMGTSHKLRFKYPPVGVFQCEDTAMIFRRHPVKQYKRGLCTGNSALGYAHSYVTGTDRRIGLEYTYVAAAFQAVKYKYKDAVRMLASGKYRSVALYNNFVLMLSPTKESKAYLLLHWDIPVAWINKSDGTLYQLLEKAYESIIPQVMVG